MRFIASFEKTVQLTEDHWGVTLQTLLCDENTTIGRIREWQRDNLRISAADSFKMNDMKISEPEEVKP
jgi:hypothetical protein